MQSTPRKINNTIPELDILCALYTYKNIIVRGYNMEKGENYPESVDELRQRLETMKRMMAERQMTNLETENSRRQQANSSIIDGSFLSVVFGIALIVIITVSIYAFYNLYNAILKKFPSHHTEL